MSSSSPEGDLSTLGPYPSEGRAQMAVGALDGHGIDARLEERDDGWIVHVDPADHAAAREVLRPREEPVRHSRTRLVVELLLGLVVAISLYAAVVAWLAG